MTDNEDQMEICDQFCDEFGHRPLGIHARPITLDQEERARRIYYEELYKITDPHSEFLIEIHKQRVKKEWFYRLFYEYNRCNLNKDLEEMFKFICESYPLVTGEDKEVRKVVTEILATEDLLTKKFMALVFIGSERDIGEHIYKKYEEEMSKKSEENKFGIDLNKIKKLVLNKPKRLLAYLQKMVNNITMDDIKQTNVRAKIVNFIICCFDLYESGVNRIE